MTDNLTLFERSTFICGSCGAIFSAARDDSRVDEETAKLFTQCPACTKEAEEAWWMANLRKGHGKQTGPTSEAGKERSSRNSVKHGGYSDSFLYPRKPGEYPECENCNEKEECESDTSLYCHRKIEIHNKFMLAIKSGDPEAIKSIAASNFAQAQQVINSLFLDIFRLGSVLESPAWAKVRDSEGAETIEAIEIDDKQVFEYNANPAIGKVTDLLKGMGFTLPEFSITPKGQQDVEILKGHLDERAASRQTEAEYLKARGDALANLDQTIKDAKKLRKEDETTARLHEDHEADQAREEKDEDNAGAE